MKIWGVSLDSLKEWFTLLAAFVAALTSTISWWKGLNEKNYNIKVNFGAIQPPIAPGLGLHVIR